MHVGNQSVVAARKPKRLSTLTTARERTPSHTTNGRVLGPLFMAQGWNPTVTGDLGNEKAATGCEQSKAHASNHANVRDDKHQPPACPHTAEGLPLRTRFRPPDPTVTQQPRWPDRSTGAASEPALTRLRPAGYGRAWPIPFKTGFPSSSGEKPPFSAGAPAPRVSFGACVDSTSRWSLPS